MNAVMFLNNSLENVDYAKDFTDVCSTFVFIIKGENELKKEDYSDFKNSYFLFFKDMETLKKDVFRISHVNGFAPDFIISKGSILDMLPICLLKTEKTIKCPCFSIIDSNIEVPLSFDELIILNSLDACYFESLGKKEETYIKVTSAILENVKGFENLGRIESCLLDGKLNSDEKKDKIKKDMKERFQKYSIEYGSFSF